MTMTSKLAMGILLATVMLAMPVLAHDYRLGALHIEHPWSRATPPGTSVGAGYMGIVNEGERPQRLVGASSPVADKVQIHRTVEQDGTAEMRHQKDGVVVAAGSTVAFEPGSYHLMLMGLADPLEEGQRIPVTLEFEPAGRVTVELAVESLTGGEHADH
jgi:copper(I)-binding protein